MKRRRRNKDPRAVQVRLFVCPECFCITPATKRYGETQEGHIKTMWCYKCHEDREFIQVE